MNLLDWLLVLLVVLFAISGYWQGFLAGAFSTAGLILGGLVGIWLVPHLLGSQHSSLWVSLGALLVVLLGASVGQVAFQYVGVRVRETIRWQPARSLDAVGGSVLSAAAVLVVAWMLGVAVTGASIPTLSNLVRDSRVLASVNDVMPHAARNTMRGFDAVVGSNFPRYLEPFVPERIVNVAPPSSTSVQSAAVQRAQQSVFKLRSSNRCNQGVEGSGFVYAPGKLMTNAHVVAGVGEPHVQVGGRSVSGTVVYYDPETDVAVLDVPGLGAPPLAFNPKGAAGEEGATLGYPLDGPYDVEPARIRQEQRLRSPDIYGAGTVSRDVFSVRSRIRPGNSGGPLVSLDGRVLGVVFAASVSDSQTGYVLTADQVADAAAAGRTRTAAVDTGNCA